jgi:hypothetical protein
MDQLEEQIATCRERVAKCARVQADFVRRYGLPSGRWADAAQAWDALAELLQAASEAADDDIRRSYLSKCGARLVHAGVLAVPPDDMLAEIETRRRDGFTLQT